MNIAGKHQACSAAAVQLSASRGQEQAGRCMGWKDKEHRREKQGVQLYVEYTKVLGQNYLTEI